MSLDTLIIRKPSLPPVARYVYLLNDTTDVNRFGVANNIYSTFQTAYDAANTLATALGARVAIVVGNTIAATVGNLTLTANWNSNVIIIGQNKTSSLLGNIDSSNAAASAFTVPLTAYDCTIGTITAQATGAGTGDSGGAVTLLGEFICGNISTICNNAAITTGVGGAVNIGATAIGRITCGSITTKGGSTGNAGAVTLANFTTAGVIDTSGGTTANCGGVIVVDSFTSTITMTSNGSATIGVTYTRAVTAGGGSTLNSTSTGRFNINVTNSTVTNFNVTIGNAAANYQTTFRDSTISDLIITAAAANTRTWTIRLQNSTLPGTLTATNSGSGIVLIGTPNSFINAIAYTNIKISEESQITTNTTLDLTNRNAFVNTTGGNITITLPSAATSANAQFYIKRITGGSNTLSIVEVAAGNIDGSASVSIIDQYSEVTVVSDGTQYWIISDYNAGIVAGGNPIARYVYLINDASDQTRMGGTPGNTYITFQAAYDAANTLATSLGSVVELVVGNTIAATVGNLTLTADYNTNVIIVGESKSTSLLGNIVASNAAGSGFSIGTSTSLMFKASDCTIGTINTSATGASGNSGSIFFGGNFICGTITTSITSTSNTAGIGGNITLNNTPAFSGTISGRSICGNIDTSTTTNSTTSAGAVTINNGWLVSGTLTTTGATSATAGIINIINSEVSGTITSVNNDTSATSVTHTINNSKVATVTITNGSASAESLNLTIINYSVLSGALTYNITGSGGGSINSLTIRSSGLTSIASTLGAATDAAGVSYDLRNVILTSSFTITNTATTNNAIVTCNIRQSIMTALSHTFTSNGSSTFNLRNSIFTSTTSTVASRSVSLREGGTTTTGNITLNMSNCTLEYGYLQIPRGTGTAKLSNNNHGNEFLFAPGNATGDVTDMVVSISGSNTFPIVVTPGSAAVNIGNYSLYNLANCSFAVTGTTTETLTVKMFHCSMSAVTYTSIATLTINYFASCIVGGTAISYATVTTIVDGSSQKLNQATAPQTYTPTLTNTTNVAASTAYACQYLIDGKNVTVSGKVDIDPTAAGNTVLGVSLPIASNIAAAENCGGTASAPGIAGLTAAILGDLTNDRATIQYTAVDITNQSFYFSFTYRII